MTGSLEKVRRKQELNPRPLGPEPTLFTTTTACNGYVVNTSLHFITLVGQERWMDLTVMGLQIFAAWWLHQSKYFFCSNCNYKAWFASSCRAKHIFHYKIRSIASPQGTWIKDILLMAQKREKSPAPGRIWTHDLSFMRRVLYHCATAAAQKRTHLFSIIYNFWHFSFKFAEPFGECYARNNYGQSRKCV